MIEFRPKPDKPEKQEKNPNHLFIRQSAFNKAHHMFEYGECLELSRAQVGEVTCPPGSTIDLAKVTLKTQAKLKQAGLLPPSKEGRAFKDL